MVSSSPHRNVAILGFPLASDRLEPPKELLYQLPLADFGAGVVRPSMALPPGRLVFCATCGTAPVSVACCPKSLVSCALSAAMVKGAILDT